MDTPSSLIEQAKERAKLYAIDPALLCAQIEQESGWDVYAIRYEPAFFVKYVAKLPGLSDTERQARSTSWGLGQIMGQVARENGFNQRFLSALCDPDFNLSVMCKIMAKHLANKNGDEAQALLAYNGGGNPEYPLQVLARKDKYK